MVYVFVALGIGIIHYHKVVYINIYIQSSIKVVSWAFEILKACKFEMQVQ